ncbi:MAG: hypothetical protein KDI30_13020 [Pseudomonadales bacterium]|nr:hypothetical protein [Pseudomonadales bacterium]
MAAESESLLQDTGFERGLQVMANVRHPYTRGEIEEDVLVAKTGKLSPVWRLNQWYNTYSIMDALPIMLEKGGVRWELVKPVDGVSQFFKSVTLAPDNSERGDVILSQNAFAEYALAKREQREAGKASLYIDSLEEGWPHLLLAQSLKSERLSKFSALHFSLDARLLGHRANIHEGYQKSLHAARFVVAISVQNTLSQNNLWLMLPVYDSRFPFSGFGCRKCLDDGEENCYWPKTRRDKGRWLCPLDGENWQRNSTKLGTNSLLFRVPTKALTQGDIHSGEWVHFESNLMPYIEEAIQAARDSKKTSGFSGDLHRYRITLFTLGWEITGLDEASVQIKNLQFNAVRKPRKISGHKFIFHD